MNIVEIKARQILDSRGMPTIEADVILEGGVFGRAAVPSGASTGEHEAHELRDGAKQFNGQGVLKAINNVQTEILEALKGMPADDQQKIDEAMIALDGTENKSRLGANAILAVSLACAHAAAKQKGVLLYQHINELAGNPEKSLPMPMMNVLNGGKHASNSSDFQEFMIIPKSAKSYEEAILIGCTIFHDLKKIIANNGLSTAVGDEGGFTYPVQSNTQMLDLLKQASEKNYQLSQDVVFALDVAASEFYQDGAYNLSTESRKLSPKEMIQYLINISRDYPVASIEDGLDQNAWEDWRELTTKLSNIQLVGDDLFVTNPERLKQGIGMGAGNAILIKPNQIGTLTETINTIQMAKHNNYRTIISHRSGETEDTTIVHLAIGTGADQIKTGSLSRSERTAKHNEILRIEMIDKSLKLASPF